MRSQFNIAIWLCATAAVLAGGGWVPSLMAGWQSDRLAQAVDTPAAPEGQAAAGTPAAVLDDQQVLTVLGKNVRSRDNEDMGRIVDVVTNRAGQVLAAIVDFGGFLGVGTRKIAVDWKALHFEPSGKPDHVSVNLSRNQVRLAPEYKPGEPVIVIGADQGQSGNPPPATSDK